MASEQKFLITEYTHENLNILKSLIIELTDSIKLLEPEISASGNQIVDSYVQILVEGIEKERGKIWLVKDGTAVVGFAAAQVKKEDDEAVEHLYVSDLAVTESMRGMGLGKKLLERCEVYASELSLHFLRIGAQASNSGAVRLYQRFGFKEYLTIFQKKVS